MRVFVYFNLHRKVWSIKALEGPDKGRVVAHSNYVILRNVTPKVSEAGRQRVLRERRKNVHAGLVGDWTEGGAVFMPFYALDVTYNPYKHETFIYVDSDEEYTGSGFAYLAAKTVRVWEDDYVDE